MLVLLDIDMTLLTTGGAGAAALREAGAELFGPAFTTEGVRFGGGIDPLLIRAVLARNGIADTPKHRQMLRDRYTDLLPARLAGCARPLPGASEVVSLLRARAGVTVGVLTGNFEATGRAKLVAAGFDQGAFAVCVWGDDSPHEPPSRDHLPAVALERWSALVGGAARADRAVVVGDTEHDVACARAAGCWSLGVASGSVSRRALLEAGADHAVDSLRDSAGVVQWLVQRAMAHPV